jgi:hypothetical protein
MGATELDQDRWQTPLEGPGILVLDAIVSQVLRAEALEEDWATESVGSLVVISRGDTTGQAKEDTDTI